MPRRGNSLDVLIDGERALGEIAEAMGRARSHVHIAGWHVTPHFALRPDRSEIRLRELLADLAERVEVRVLLWAGPPLPVFHPHRSDVRAVRDELMRGTKIRCVLDARERTMHCHHEKLVIVDDAVAFVGGIDLTSLGGDRCDGSAHRAQGRLGWHDIATQLHGPAVGDVADHFRQRWQEVSGEGLPPAPPPTTSDGEVEVQVVRTLPERTYRFAPRGDFRILETYLRALRSAERLIYIENQFLWSTEIAAILSEKLRNPPSEDFRIVLLLPARPNNGADTTRGQLGCLIEADGGRGRVLAATVHARTGDWTDPVYVHAKVAIVDDHWLTIGSANGRLTTSGAVEWAHAWSPGGWLSAGSVAEPEHQLSFDPLKNRELLSRRCSSAGFYPAPAGRSCVPSILEESPELVLLLLGQVVLDSIATLRTEPQDDGPGHLPRNPLQTAGAARRAIQVGIWPLYPPQAFDNH